MLEHGVGALDHGIGALEHATTTTGVHAIPRPADECTCDALEGTEEDIEAMVAEVGPAGGCNVDGNPHGDGDDGEGKHLRELWLCGGGNGGGGAEWTDFPRKGERHREDEGGEEKGGVG